MRHGWAGYPLFHEGVKKSFLVATAGSSASPATRPSRLTRLNPIPTIRRTLVLCAALAAAACGDGGGAPALESRTEGLTFEPTPVGRLSPPRVVEWSNAAADTVAIVEVRVEGEGRADFVVEEDLCGSASLPPGASCTVVVLFGPWEPGSRAASIAPVTAFGAGPAVALHGDGVADTATPVEAAGLVRAVPETLAFGEQPIGAMSGPLAVRLVNQRSGSVQFAARLGGGLASEYRIALDRCSNEILRPGRACTIRILFAPASEGMRSAELVLRDLNGTTTQTVPLAGSGIGAAQAPPGVALEAPGSVPLLVSPRALEFGVQATGSSSAPRLVQVENKSAASVGITALRLAGDSASAFRIVGGNCERRSLVPTRGCAFEVVFEPPAGGLHAARVEALTSVGVEPALVLLAGTGETR